MTAQIFKLSASNRPASTPGLSDQDCFTIAGFLKTLPGYWLAQRDEDAKGAVFMTIFPNTEITSSGSTHNCASYTRPSFIVHRDHPSYRLSGSLMKRVPARYDTLSDLLQDLRRHAPGGFQFT